MPSTLKTCGILALSLLGVANAHMKMASPVPFNVANLENSPLAADGSNFPCKAVSGSAASYSISAMNELPVDKPILLSLAGSAPHDGGTCQVSITFDEEPTKESVFKVIQTFEGGCPVNNAKFTFNLPKEFPNAERATLAWTWFNRIGNREMYMDCAPISITGGSDNKDYYESLPDMFVANIATTECAVAEGSDVQVPDPGEFVLQGPTAKLLPPSTEKCPSKARANNTKSGKATNFAALSAPATDYNKIIPVAGGGASSGASPSVPAVGGGGNDGSYTPPAAAPAQPSPTAATPNNGLYSQPAASAASSSPSSAAASAPALTATAPAPTASAPAPTTSTPPAAYSTFKSFTIPASSATTSSAPPPAYPTLSPSMGQGVSGPSSGGSAASSTVSPSSPSNGAAASSTTCTTEGAVVCNGTDQFGLCNHGSVVWQKVASGTTCSNGSIQKRSAAQHTRRHAHGAFKVRAS
jgi:hypothetical protein